MSNLKFYEVGGCIRDEILGIPSKDVDFTVIGSSYREMVIHLKSVGFKIHKEYPEHLTVRAGVPKDHQLYERTHDADFVLSRKDGPSKDGRRPEYVEMGTLEDDLTRRDFTVNAIARDCETGEIIDLFNGEEDCKNRILKFVGNPYDRIKEDGLRVMRAYRFELTKGFTPTAETREALMSKTAEAMLGVTPVERIQDELEKMLKFSTPQTLHFLNKIPDGIFNKIFRDGLRLSATMKR